MNKYEIENIYYRQNPKSLRGSFFSWQVKVFQGRQKLQVTCPAGQVVSNVNVKPWQWKENVVQFLMNTPSNISLIFLMQLKKSA